jgi:ribonuclease HI
MSPYARLTIYTDGASRGNPGPAASGVHIIDENLETVADLSFALGTATNNVAEYQAVLHAVTWLLEHKELLANDIHILFRMDSQLVASQLSGKFRIKDPGLRRLAEKIAGCFRQLPGTFAFDHIPREDNKEADALANDALDRLG